MKCSKTTLPNGLRVLVIPMPHLESATITVWVAVGSRYEPQKVSGISHFLEHMVFKGGQRYRSAKAVSEAVDSFGGEFNAATGKEITQYYIKAPSDKLDRAFDVLSDIVLTPLLKPADIAREKGVIKAELDMYEDTPVRKVEEVYENLIFKYHPLGRDIIGTKKTITSIAQPAFKKYINNHYHASNMLITVAGGINQKNILSLAQKYFTKLPKGKKVTSQPFQSSQKKPQTILKYKKTDQAHLIIGFLGDRLDHPSRYPEAVLASILGGGMSSRLFTEVREKRGLAYAVKTYADHYTDTGRFTTYAGVAPAKADEAIKTILSEYQKMISVRSNKVSNKEFKKAKEFLKGRLALSLEDTSQVNQFFGTEELLLGKIRSVEQVYQAIDQVKLEDIIAVAQRFFTPERLNLAAIGPFKNKAKFAKLLEL